MWMMVECDSWNIHDVISEEKKYECWSHRQMTHSTLTVYWFYSGGQKSEFLQQPEASSFEHKHVLGHFLDYLVLSFFLEGLSRFSSSSWSMPALRKKMSHSLTAPCLTFSSSPSFTLVLCLFLLGKAGAGLDSEHFRVSLRASEPRLAKMCAYRVGFWMGSTWTWIISFFIKNVTWWNLKLFFSLGTKFNLSILDFERP